MQKRNISTSIVEYVLSKPDNILDENGKRIYQSIVGEQNNQFLIRIIRECKY